MASVLMQKDGEIIRVFSGNVAFHEALGWSLVKNDYGKDNLILPPGGIIQYLYGDNLVESLLVQHYQVSPLAVSAVAIHAAANLGAAVLDVNTGLTNPDVPRTITVKGNLSGISGNVTISGRNILGEFMTDVIALNGATEVEGAKAFASITNIRLPVQTHSATAQAETATAVGTITGSGNASVVVTAAGMSGTPKTISVAVLENDTAADWADKVRTALAADAAVVALFNVSGATDKIILTRKTPAANDTSLNIALDNGNCTGITTASSSANTTAGVAYDTVSVGMAKKFGLPQIVANAACLLVKLFNASADLGTLAVDDDEIEKNLYSLDGTPDGSALDLYYLA
jgi:hypothetical protein